MPRVKRGTVRRAKRKKLSKLTKGYFQNKSKLYKFMREAAEKAGQILGLNIKGHLVEQVMVAEGADIAEEYYFSVLLDRANRTYLAMCSVEGGMEIEEVAAEEEEVAAALSEPRDAIEEIVEPFLIQQGMLQRTPRGRVAAISAYRHFGIAQPQRAGGVGELF